MAAGLILEFEGVTSAEYDAVNDKLGIDTQTGKGDWPDGLLVHGSMEADGHLRVVDVWESAGHFERFLDGRLSAGRK